MPRDLHILQMLFIMVLKSPRINGMRRWIILIIIIPSIRLSNINILGTFLSNLIVVIIFFSVVKTKPNMRDVVTTSLKWVKFAFKKSQSDWLTGAKSSSRRTGGPRSAPTRGLSVSFGI